jgi:hypothetical protein
MQCRHIDTINSHGTCACGKGVREMRATEIREALDGSQTLAFEIRRDLDVAWQIASGRHVINKLRRPEEAA